MDEKSLVLLLQKGDSDAFNKVYYKYAGHIYKSVERILLDPFAAEEVVQETFIKLWEIKDQLNEELSLGGYISVIARNLALKTLKKQVKISIVDRQFAQEKDEHSGLDADKALIYEEISQALQLAIKALPTKARLVFQLSREEGLSNKEIAQRLNLSIRTVENHIQLAMKKIRACLPVFLLLSIIPS